MKETIVAALERILARRKRSRAPQLEDSMPLFTEGLNLDSLEVAELSAMLTGELGRDPFSDGELPETVGQLVRYYEQ